MLRFSLLPSAAVLMMAFTFPAAAGTSACQTVNGQTVCMQGPGTMSCTTINSRTTCTGTGPLSRTETSRTEAPPALTQEMPTLPPDRLKMDWLKDMNGPDVSIRQDGSGMHIQTGGLDLHLE